MTDFLEYLSVILKECDYCLVHEAALTAYGINYNLFPYHYDLLISKSERNKAEKLIPAEQCSRVRLLTEINGLTYEELLPSMKRVRPYGCRVLEPEKTLELFPFSADFEKLREQYAKLALVLYADEMSDEEFILMAQQVH